LKTAQANEDVALVKSLLSQLLVANPENPRVLLAAAEVHWRQANLGLARQYLDMISPQDRQYMARAEGLRGLMEFQQVLSTLSPDEPLDQQFAAACRAALRADYAGALENFLGLVQHHRTYRNDGARQAMLTLFKLLGDSHPLTKRYRQQLMQALY